MPQGSRFELPCCIVAAKYAQIPCRMWKYGWTKNPDRGGFGRRKLDAATVLLKAEPLVAVFPNDAAAAIRN